jgi:hypothetical protein
MKLSTNGPCRAIMPLLSEGQGKTRLMADALLLMLAIEVVNHPIHRIKGNGRRQQEEQNALFPLLRRRPVIPRGK